MKNFSDFLSENANNYYTPIQTTFGRQPKPANDNQYESIRVIFGKHSHLPHVPIKEDFEHENFDHIDNSLSSKLQSHKAQQTHEILKKHYHYEPHQVHQIGSYTNNSESLNNSLYKNKGHIDKLRDKHQEQVKKMDELVHRHKTPHEFHVYTGLHHAHNLTKIKAKQNGSIHAPIKVQHHAYTSTSLDKRAAKNFAHSTHEIHKTTVDEHGHPHHIEEHHRHMLKIHVPAGHHGAYVDHHSSTPGEKEFILPRGTKLHVHPIPHTETNTIEYHENGKRYTSHHHFHIWPANIAHEK